MKLEFDIGFKKMKDSKTQLRYEVNYFITMLWNYILPLLSMALILERSWYIWTVGVFLPLFFHLRIITDKDEVKA